MDINSNMIVAVNPSVQATIQDRTLQRTFRDVLMPRSMFRMEAVADLWVANTGDTHVFTKRGDMPTNERPLAPNQDPPINNVAYEQWEVTAAQWGDSVETNMPTSHFTLASQYLSNVHALGVSAGKTMNRAVRNTGYNAYTEGSTVATPGESSGGTSLRVANLNGFTRKLLNGRQQLVSATNPLQIQIAEAGPTVQTVNVVGWTADFTGPTGAPDEIHSGTLTLATTIAATVANRAYVIATNRSSIVYSGGGNSIDDLSTSDTMTMKDIRTAVALLRTYNVSTQEDNTFHFHIDPVQLNQLYLDQEWKDLHRGLIDHVHYAEFAVAKTLNCTFYENTEAPYLATINDDPVRGFVTGFEKTNGASINVHRAIVTAQDWIEEYYVDESRFISQAGIMGKIGEFAITNNGVQVMTERVRLIMRAPLDALQQKTTATWSFSGAWTCPPDELAPGGRAAHKRAIIVASGE